MTDTVPTVPIKHYKKVKILATYGPATEDYDQVVNMIKSGANGIRLNFSHGSHDYHGNAIKLIRKASKELGKPVAVIQDLQGPKIRLGMLDDDFKLEKGQSFRLKYNADFDREGALPVQYDLSTKVKRGERMYFCDGKIKTEVTLVKDGIIHLRADNGGVLSSKKGINLPDTDFGGDIITEKDKQDIIFGASIDVDYVALSFVQTADDIDHIKKLLVTAGSNAKVIAKIETRAAVDNIDNIARATDVLMVARGDLASETSVEEVPIIQRKIIRLGVKYAKPTIVATQMLASMVDNPEPTRAEAGDVATAVLVGVDCLMLSDETTVGKYPIDAIKMMKKIIKYTEIHTTERMAMHWQEDNHTRQTAISKAVISLAYDVHALAIVPETKSGATAYRIASYRPALPIIAVTSSEKVARQLSIVYGVKSFIRKDEMFQATHLTEWLQKNKVLKKGDVVVIISGLHPGVVGATDTIKVRLVE
ncbi:MAG: pyruvate kinase [Patescibacteria group bacterium]|jgi:pyruvate kinase|nr:pyruvate kinase [Patescibacteria group bacterium]